MSTYKYTAKIKLPDGKYKYVRANTKKELEEKKLKVQLELRAGIDISDKTTFKEFYEMWFRTYKVGKVKPQSEAVFKRRIEKNILPYIGELQMKKITPMVMAGMFAKLDKQGLSRTTQKLVHSDCNQIFEVAVDNGLIMRSPLTKSVQIGGEKSKKKEAIPDSDVEILLDYLQDDPMLYNMVQFDLATGLRIGELFALKWKDIDMAAQTVHVHATAIYHDDMYEYQESPKTTAGNRTIPFNTDTKKILTQMKLLRKGEFVFHDNGKMSGQEMYSRVVYVLKKAPTETHISAHLLRHTCITRWIVNGMPVSVAQYLAGHSTAAMTLNVYTSFTTQDHLKVAADLLSKSATKVQPDDAPDCTEMHQDENPEPIAIAR